QRGLLARQRALGFDASAKFLVEPLNHVCGAERLPLRLGEAEERDKFVAAFSEARHHTRAALAPRALEGAVGDTRSVSAGRVGDAMKGVADLVEGMLRRFTREIAQLVDAAALDGNPRPDESDGASQPRIAVDDRQHRRPQSPRDEIVEAAFPRRERLASA